MKWFNPLLHNNAFLHLLKYNIFENIMENGAFALLEQMLHFSYIFKSVQNLCKCFLIFCQCYLKIVNDVMIEKYPMV